MFKRKFNVRKARRYARPWARGMRAHANAEMRLHVPMLADVRRETARIDAVDAGHAANAVSCVPFLVYLI